MHLFNERKAEEGAPGFLSVVMTKIRGRNIVETRSHSVFEQEHNRRSHVAPGIFPNRFLGTFPVDLSWTNG